MERNITRDVILIIVVLAGLTSFFFNPQDIDMTFLQTIMGGIVGFYVGAKALPFGKSR